MAQEESAEAESNPEAATSQLSVEQIQAIIRHSRNREWTDVLTLTEGVDKGDPAYQSLLNLRLSALVQIKDFDKALAALAEMKEFEMPEELLAFNFGEVYFLKGDYDKASDQFINFLSSEGNEMNALARYKLFLSYLLAGEEGDAIQLKNKIHPTISHPLYYYVQAAHCFHQDKEDEARDWIQSAAKIYNMVMNVAFADALKEIGWLLPHEVTGIPVLTSAQLKSLNNEFQPADPEKNYKKESFLDKLLPDFGKK
ncbi:MAG: hypothetical protein AAFY98_11655 [Verrucomicrobiota bacterium]